MPNRYPFNEILNPVNAAGRLRLQENFTRTSSYLASISNTAQQALQKITEIKNIANEAKDTANQAKDIAQGIDGKATRALNTANTANSKSDEAKQTANIAKSIAEGIDGKAQQALDTANAAEQKSDEAVNTAEHAEQVAESIRDQFDQVVAEAGSNNPEVVQARGGFVNLRARLDEEKAQVTAQLAQVAYTVGYRDFNEDDDTGRIQRAIDALPVGGVLTGANKHYVVTSLHLKSDMEFVNFKLLSKAGNTPLQSPVTVGGYGDSTVKRNIKIKNVHIDGNRVNQTNLATTEDGGRSGFRFIGAIENLLLEDSSACHCATDGIILYAGIDTGALPTTEGIKKNITVRNCEFNYNRRHGGSGDSLTGIQFENCKFKYNGIDIDGGLTEGNKGATVNGNTYGNGFDFEEYSNEHYIGNITMSNCELVGNASSGILVMLATNQNATNSDFTPRKNFKFINCTLDKGVSGLNFYGLQITPSADHRDKGIHYQNIDIIDCNTDPILLRTVDNVLVKGGNIQPLPGGRRELGLLDHVTNIIADTIRPINHKFQTNKTQVSYVHPKLPNDISSITRQLFVNFFDTNTNICRITINGLPSNLPTPKIELSISGTYMSYDATENVKLQISDLTGVRVLQRGAMTDLLSISNIQNTIATNGSISFDVVQVKGNNDYTIDLTITPIRYAYNGVEIDVIAILDFESDISAYQPIGNAPMLFGYGNPEGVLVAPRGSIYQRLDGDVNTTLYVKTTNNGNVGWVAK